MTIGFPALSVFPATGAFTPSAASRRASSSALVGNSFFPVAFLSAFACSSAARAIFSASNSALVGNNFFPAGFFVIFFVADFFTGFAVDFAETFLTALFFAGVFATDFFLLAPFLSARITATDHPLVCLASHRTSETCLTIL